MKRNLIKFIPLSALALSLGMVALVGGQKAINEVSADNEPIVDTINIENCGATSSPKDLNFTLDSGAHYYMKAAKAYSNIRFAEGHGLSITTTVGVVQSITIEWNTTGSMGSGKQIDVFGSYTAYTSGQYGSGEDIGSFIYSEGTNTNTINLTTKYPYISLIATVGPINIMTINFTYSTSELTNVSNFIDTYMHLDHTTNDGSCKLWYQDMKDAFNGLTADEKNIILNSEDDYKTVGDVTYKYSDIKNRIYNWASANEDTFDTTTGVFSLNKSSYLIKENTNNVGIVLTIVLGSILIASGSFYMLSRIKYNK